MPCFQLNNDWFLEYYNGIDRRTWLPVKPLYPMDGWPGPARIGYFNLGSSPLVRLFDWLPEQLFYSTAWAFAQLMDLAGKLVPPVLPALTSFLVREWQLHVEPRHYRDHLLHSLMVAGVGSFLLQRRWPLDEHLSPAGKGPSLIRDVVARLQNGDEHQDIRSFRASCGLSPTVYDEQLVMQTWWTAALLHDLAYVHELAGRLQKETARVTSFWPQPVAEHLDRYLMGYNKIPGSLPDLIQPVVADLHGWTWGSASHNRALRELSLMAATWHAPCGALLLLAMLADLHRYGQIEPRTWFIYNLAARSILLHDLNGYVKQFNQNQSSKTNEINLPSVAFRDDPISFLLILSDQTQSWGRVKAFPLTIGGGWGMQLEFREFPHNRVDLELTLAASGASDPLPSLKVWGDVGTYAQSTLKPEPMFRSLEWEPDPLSVPPPLAPTV